jgi:hypothetical protein
MVEEAIRRYSVTVAKHPTAEPIIPELGIFLTRWVVKT